MHLLRLAAPLAGASLLVLPVAGVAHFDHAPPAFSNATPASPAFISGGPNAVWESMGSIPTGNPHTDLDFFTQKGETYASVGTLGTGANGGGQTIVKLTTGGKPGRASFVVAHPSAACGSNPSAVLGLQHDVEATPKGGTILNTPNALAAPGPAQLLLDATDAGGRCHDQGVGGVSAAPRGGLEIIDIADDVAKPKEIGLTSHVGESPGAQATICTSHVMQQIPGQNRIFMAWYSQGTQVFDFVENADGTITFREAGYFILAAANQWSSAVYKAERNADGSFTDFGAAGDFNLGEGRSSIDLYKVTLPAPPTPQTIAGVAPAANGTPAQGGVPAVTPVAPGARVPAPCTASGGLRSISARPSGAGLRFAFAGDRARADIDVFQVSSGSRVVTERLVARFANKASGFSWNGRSTRTRRAVAPGQYIVRYRVRGSRGGSSSLRLTVRRGGRGFSALPAFERRGSCTTLQRYKLERPVFGGSGKAPLRAAIHLTRAASVSLELLRGGKVVKRLAARTVEPNRTARLRIAPEGLARGSYQVRITVTEGRRKESATLVARRL